MLLLHPIIQAAGVYSTEPFIVAPAPKPYRHVILLDSGLGQAHLCSLAQQYRKADPPLPTIILEMADDLELILACIEAGACGYTLRGACVDEVIRVIVGALRGEAYCAPAITACLFERLSQSHKPSTTLAEVRVPLTKRELEVLNYIARGHSNLEIATTLSVEVRTVKHHVHNILEKLHLRHRWDAVRVATESGWLEVAEQTRAHISH